MQRSKLMEQVYEGTTKRESDLQGLGRKIVSHNFNGTQFVAVGSRLLYSKQWKTFHDFLDAYLKNLLGAWGQNQANKSKSGCHPIFTWYDQTNRHNENFTSNDKGLYEVSFIGANQAWLQLAYDLYCLDHNIEVQDKLLNRLKEIDQFWGALSEVKVAAIMIRAGYEIEFENEDDRSSSLCGFTATKI